MPQRLRPSSSTRINGTPSNTSASSNSLFAFRASFYRLPAASDAFTQLFMTHPTLAHRVGAIVNNGQIPTDRLARILDEAGMAVIANQNPRSVRIERISQADEVLGLDPNEAASGAVDVRDEQK